MMASEYIDAVVLQSLAPEELMSDSGKTLSDLPPESFWVPEDYEQDWLDRNAVMQRKSSIKLGFLASSIHSSKSFSHRFSACSIQNHRPSLLGLPNTTQASNHLPNQAGNPQLSRSRSEPEGKAKMQFSEPVSPRVSCTGRVAAKNCGERVRVKNGGRRKTSFLSFFNSIFRGKGKLQVAGGKDGLAGGQLGRTEAV